MKRTRKLMAIVLVLMMVFCYMPGAAFAETDEAGTNFTDMPNDWSTAALKNAVSNGLIKGYEGEDGTYIKPAGTLTRAEMATVVNRAFGAEDKASLSGANDIAAGAWYEAEMAKAVQMGTIKKDTQMRPNANITRQEACTILARAFKMECEDSSHAALNGFADKNAIASWAEESLCALVEAGYMSGSGGNLNPAANMTRAEFAKIMDNMVKQYITEAGIAENITAAGNVMINVPGVELKNSKISGNLIIGDGIGSGELTLDSVNVSGDTVVRGGGVNSIIITGDSNLGNVIVAKVNGNVRVSVEGNAKVNVVVIADGKNDVQVEGKIATLKVDAETPVMIQKAEITKVEVTAANAAVTVSKDSTVTTMSVEAAKADLSIEGTVKTIVAEKAAEGTNLEIAKDAKVDKLETNAEINKTGEGNPSTTTGTGSITEGGSTTTPDSSTGGSTGGGGGGGGSSADSGPANAPSLVSLTVTPTTGSGTASNPYVIAKNVDANTAKIKINIGNIEDARTYKAEVTIKNSAGTVRATAGASTIGSNVNTLLNNRELTLSDLARGLAILGDEQSSIGTDLMDIFNNKMLDGEVYSMTVKITPVGFDSKATTETIYLKKI